MNHAVTTPLDIKLMNMTAMRSCSIGFVALRCIGLPRAGWCGYQRSTSRALR
jgi:hypothetical protein